MVTPLIASRPRAGFSLVEVLTALVLLGTGGLCLAATGQWGGRLLTETERAEAAQVLAANVLDSLFQVGAPGAGELSGQGVRLEWVVSAGGAGLLRVELRFLEPGALADAPPLVMLRRREAGASPDSPREGT